MTNRPLLQIVPATTQAEGVGAIVHRTIGTHGLDHVDPFLLLDEFTSKGGKEGGGFPDHPHRGFETVTYMLEGRMEHADNKGHRGIIDPGGIQWMTAGSGLVHSEMPANEAGEPIRGMQLWVNLPARDKMTAPRYQELGSEDIPEVALDSGGKVRIIAGVFQDTKGAASDIAVEPLYLDLHLTPGESVSVPLPRDHTAFVYGLEGEFWLKDDERRIAKRSIGLLGTGDELNLIAGSEGARLILIAAAPIREPVARYGPFVMNTNEEIHQAFADFRAGRF